MVSPLSIRFRHQPSVLSLFLLIVLSSRNTGVGSGVLAQPQRNEDDCTCSAPGPSTAVGVNSNNNILIGRSSCDPNNTTYCALYCGGDVSSSYLQDKCCIHAGKSASLLAFEEDSKWIPRLEEFNLCTGATVRLEYLPEGEDGMADALVQDVGTDQSSEGEGIFDAYIVQAPWLPPVVEGLENLSPRIKEHADTVNFLDINPASRSAVSFNGTVKALPLDTDYVAIGWRQDVFYQQGLELQPPSTIEELADIAEQLHGLDHNDDGEPDWGICLSPQVNYFYAFVAPVLQSQKFDSETYTPTGQNIFFDTDTFEPLLRVAGFRYALEQYWRVIRSSNCAEQLVNGQPCDRRTAWPTGRCAMVISMPGTLTSMLLNSGSRAPRDRTDADGNVVWSIRNQPLGPGGTHWGRRARFPGSRFVQAWDADAIDTLISCEEKDACPLADSDGINYAPFFAEGGEAYALNGRQSKPSARDVMWDVFAWMSELPVSKLPLSGQYRNSHLNEASRNELVVNEGWSKQAADDLLALLGYYFQGEREGGNPAQDLLVLGFSDYMDALDEELHTNFLGVKLDSQGGLLDKTSSAKSIDNVFDADEFDAAYDHFIANLEYRYRKISQSLSGGCLGQLQRWRQSLNLPWKNEIELCSTALSIDPQAFDSLGCSLVVDMEKLCQNQPDDVSAFDPTLCTRLSKTMTTSLFVGVSLLLLVATLLAVYFMRRRDNNDTLWTIDSSELHFIEPRQLLGEGAFGDVVLAEYRGTQVAVKQLRPPANKPSEAFRAVIKTDEATWGKASQIITHFATVDPGISIAAFESEMRLLSNLRHPCIATVMGVVMRKRATPFLVMEYMELGSLHDVLHNATISLDGDLVLPILQEISQGLRFLHSADPPIVHCDLKSKNVLIDNKFRAKLKTARGTPFWMAPELLRHEAEVSPATDVFSFGVVLFEVYSRKDPYDGEDPITVIRDVSDAAIGKRPPVPATCPTRVGTMMKECLDEAPQSRPTFEEIDLRLQRMSAENVEPAEAHLSVQARRDLKASRANNLLYDVFPPHVAEALRDGRKVEPEHREMTTIFFSDIVNYTSMVSEMAPTKIADLLDRLYTKFDYLSQRHDVFKVETIGDAYMCVSNLAKDQTNDHAMRIAEFAIDTIAAANSTLIDPNDPSKGCVHLRVGFHSGPCVADCVGTRNPRYCLFGDSVNSHSEVDRIQCSGFAAKILREQCPSLQLTSRGLVNIKGKGRMLTYWVNEGNGLKGVASEFIENELSEPNEDVSYSEYSL